MRVLLPFWLGAQARSFYQEFVRGISNALRELGHQPVYLPFEDLEKYSAQDARLLVKVLERDRPDMVLDVACWGNVLTRSTSPGVFLESGIPYAAWLFDHPFNQALNGIVARRLVAVYPDLRHPQLFKFSYPTLDVAGGIFAAPGVDAANRGGASTGITDRRIDVLYVGNLDPVFIRRCWHTPQYREKWGVSDPSFCDALADAITAQPETSLDRTVEAVLNGRTWSDSLDVARHLRLVENHFRYVFRRDTVRTLARAGIPVLVVGKGWETTGLPPNVRVKPPIPYEEMFDLARAARICIDASTYLDGANDRVFSYAMSEAVCFTNAAGYLRTAFGEDGGVRFYSLLDLGRLVQEVRFWLARPDALAETGKRARAAVLSGHTWRHRLEHILGELPRQA